jgi:hypothetical protein
MNGRSKLGVAAMLVAGLTIAGCYTQFESAEEEQAPDEMAYSEADSLLDDGGPAESYDDARYRFYVNVGYPYWTTGFGISYWDPYPGDPWFWGAPGYWYPYAGYYSSVWYYPPPPAYYPPGYYWGPPVTSYPGGHAGYANRSFGSTRSYGTARTSMGTYRAATTAAPARLGSPTGLRPSTTRAGRSATTPGVTGRSAKDPDAVGKPATTQPAVRGGRKNTRSASPDVKSAPAQRKPRGSGSRQAVTPDRPPQKQPQGTTVRPRSTDSGGSRSYSPPRSSPAPSSRPSGTSAPRGGSSGGGGSSPRSGGRR